MNGATPRLYLAGPDVFHAEAAEIGRRKKALCAQVGFEGLFPLDNEIGTAGLSKAALAARIYAANIAMLHAADAVLANVTPYLGACADDGTAFEIGFAVAKGLPVALYDNGAGDTASKAAALLARVPALGEAVTPEDFGLPVNLMLAIPAQRVCAAAGGAAAIPLTDLSRFETALSALRSALDATG